VRTRLPLIAATTALITHDLVSFGRNGNVLSPYRLDLDVYRIGSLTWLHGGNLYGALPWTSARIGLPFSYPPVAAVLLSPLAMVPMAVAGFALTLASIALTLVVLRVFTRSLASRLSLWWLLPAALALEPVRATVSFGQVNIVLMALVTVDCLIPEPGWPRGTLVGLAAAVKLTPAAFILFFLIRRDRRAACTAAVSFAAVTGTGFIVDWHDSVRYWTGVVFSTSRPGSPAYVSNQSISGALARSGLDPHSPGGSAAWLALSAVIVVIAVIGMRRAIAVGEPAWALSVNALAALLISPISWTHHWVWAAPALMCLAVTGRRHSWRGGVAAACAGLVLFEVAPMWLLPGTGSNGELGWAWWEQVIGDTYVIFGAVVLVLAARFAPRYGRQPGSRAVITPTRLLSLPGRWRCPWPGACCSGCHRRRSPRRLQHNPTSCSPPRQPSSLLALSRSSGCGAAGTAPAAIGRPTHPPSRATAQPGRTPRSTRSARRRDSRSCRASSSRH
jgi:alpha-1,2-mannosyltransferase